MALDKEKLSKALREVDTRGDIPSQMAEAIDAYIREMEITVNAGIPVSTTGNSSAQSGETTATGTATIS